MAEEKGMGVKDVVLDMTKDKKCGETLADASPQPVPSDGLVKWLGNGGGGFTHVGPCEVYIDDKMVVHGDNCEDEFQGGGVGSTLDNPVDYSSCNGKCTLTISGWRSRMSNGRLTGNGSSTSPQAVDSSTGEQQMQSLKLRRMTTRRPT
ncbi:hypothetical protein PHYSODRAFT_256017 [Phytophthora sojae]|uniref:Uncharacterized protein n=1 Tax=Phytophthora sojae (strain P6497) TaxID=1094619 RepID=G5A7W4_PHYSP|nr:hypothetical protein PHYSODRAFT_256017 [Phytophthora sojae]EGZ07990.1 hypothetical protein PHYSODRAFT_256017 [Phytophthora sojae]|eukprot:XP_009536162.1 hypothetical protein PHYSODRAFT_256017 [Phytophthora sojae]